MLGLSASVEYEGEAIASVVVPQLLPPVLLPPLWSGVVDRRPPPSSSSEREQRRLTLRAANRRFPVELDAPIAKLQAPLGRPSPSGVLVSWPSHQKLAGCQALLGRLAFGSVAVSLRANITLRTGNLTNLTVAYRQENVSVALGR